MFAIRAPDKCNSLHLLALILTIRALIRGAVYIGGASKWPVGYKRPIGCTIVRRARFRATPFAIVVLFTWAGISVIHDLGWILGDFGFPDHGGEWTTYRSHVSTAGGCILGLLFSLWFITHCQSVWEQNLRSEELSPHDGLDKIL